MSDNVVDATETVQFKPEPKASLATDMVPVGMSVLQIVLRALMKAQQHEKGSPFSLDDLLPLGQAIAHMVAQMKTHQDEKEGAN